MKKMFITSVMLFTAFCMSAATWVVNSGGGGTFTDIQVAVRDGRVSDGDVLQLVGTFNVGVAIEIEKALTIQGEGPASTIVQTTGTNRAFVSYMKNKVFTLAGLTVQGNVAATELGMALFVQDLTNFTLNNVHFKNFYTSGNGAALAVFNTGSIGGANFTVTNCEFINNTCNGGRGGAIYIDNLRGGQGVVEKCTFEGNTGTSWGGTIYCGAGLATDNLIFRNCTFYKNHAGSGSNGNGTFGFSTNCNLSVHNCTFAENDNNDYIGDLHYIPNDGTPALLSIKGNLFWKSRGIVLPDNYPNPIAVEYNLSTFAINIRNDMPGYVPATNLGGQSATTDLLVDGGSSALLTDNGGLVRTIKLTGTAASNKAISFVGGTPLVTTDARGVARKTGAYDCGAYETEIVGTGVVTAVHDSDPVISEQYYNLQGITAGALHTASLQPGVYIVKQTLKSGNVRTVKQLISGN